MKHNRLPILACLTFGVIASLSAQDLTIGNARIIGPNGTVIEQGSIVVRAGKIVFRGSREPSVTSGRIIDAKQAAMKLT